VDGSRPRATARSSTAPAAAPRAVGGGGPLVATGRSRTWWASASRSSASRWDRRGVVVDERMRTAVPSVYAAGDLAGRYALHPQRRARGGAGGAGHVLPARAPSPDLSPGARSPTRSWPTRG
jgi:hypothetical protein